MAYRNGTLRRLVHAVYRLCPHARYDVAASYAHAPVKYRGGGGGVGTVKGGRDTRRRHRYKTAAAVAQGSAVVVAAASAQGCLKCAAVARGKKNPPVYLYNMHEKLLLLCACVLLEIFFRIVEIGTKTPTDDAVVRS